VLPDNYQFVLQSPIVPVMVINRLADAVPMAQALVAGGITTLEITLRTDCALEAIEAIAASVPEAIVGAGTVCSGQQFRDVLSAGARFVVSPGCSNELISVSQATDTPMLPGAVTASEVMAVRAAGFPVIKFFPAGTSGGAPAIKALGGPFYDLHFIPTGGVSPANLGDYLGLNNDIAVGGSWMIPAEACAQNDWARVEQLAREAIELANSVNAA